MLSLSAGAVARASFAARSWGRKELSLPRTTIRSAPGSGGRAMVGDSAQEAGAGETDGRRGEER